MIRNAGARLAALVAVAAAALAACAGSAAGSGTGLPVRSADPALVAKAGLAHCPQPGGAAVTGGLPTLRLPCLGGGPAVELGALRGPAVVDIGWSGCEPCRREAPVLQRFYTAAKGRVGLVGIDVEDPADGLHFAIASGVHYPVLSDPHELVKDAGLVRAYPVSYFIDAQGRVAGVRYREYRTVGDLRSDVRQLLGVAVP